MTFVEGMNFFSSAFNFESEAQKKGFLSLVQYLNDTAPQATDGEAILMVISYFIQKEHEAQEWWSKTIGDQVTSLENQIALQNRKITELHDRIR
jgi:hypothetical protein